MKYILISVIDREIYTEQKQNMRYDHEDDMYGLSDDETEGWVTDGLNHGDCNFKIFEIK